MKKINSSNQLNIEREQIQKEKRELEQKIQSQWIDLKQSISPNAIIAKSFNGPLAQKTQELIHDDGIIKSVLTYAFALVGKKMVEMLDEKLKSSRKEPKN